MVLIHVKITEKNQFLYEIPATTKIEDVLIDLITVNNLRVKIDLISVQVEELYSHGPLRREEERGLTDETLNLDKDIEEKYKPKKEPMPEKIGDVFHPDDGHRRTGWTFNEEFRNLRFTEIKEIKDKITNAKVEKKQSMKINELLECLDLLRAIIYIGYPGYHGLPNWEPCMNYLEGKCDILNMDDGIGEYYKYSTVTLWCAGREYERHKYLCDYVGKNDKTKIVCKFSNKGSGAPLREPPVDSETQKKMMQIYFKKQEEMKSLEQNIEDDYLNSKWADPKGLKNSLYTGGKEVNWKFK